MLKMFSLRKQHVGWFIFAASLCQVTHFLCLNASRRCFVHWQMWGPSSHTGTKSEKTVATTCAGDALVHIGDSPSAWEHADAAPAAAAAACLPVRETACLRVYASDLFWSSSVALNVQKCVVFMGTCVECLRWSVIGCRAKMCLAVTSH